ncbi:sag-related sequence srs53f [Cystoisospora suis]|uniref:Sag-related sequence srs53f n=1 Tax=Cystoisospora suis TaxID=483139 RepID=A0A2C6JB45_9APIC|nr:sag-related sequence srs53f [Cystoisospora suis]
MKLFFVCLSSAVAALAIKTSAVSAAGGDVAALFDRSTNLNEEGNNQLQASPRRLSTKNAVTCDTKSTAEVPDKTATFNEKTLQASFTCGSSYTQGLIPACTATTAKCCIDAKAGNDDANIVTVLGVQGQVKKGTEDPNTYTVTLEKIPDGKRGQKIYYKCKNSGDVAQDFCLVTLALPEIGTSDCAIDRVLNISLGKTASSAKFKCTDGEMTLTPFGVNNGKCSEAEKQTSAVTLTEVDKATKEYQLTVGQLPSQTEQLCYTCTYTDVPSLQDNNQKTKRTCSVIVNVEAAASSTSTVATTSSARSIVTASGALNILVAMFVSLGGFN